MKISKAAVLPWLGAGVTVGALVATLLLLGRQPQPPPSPSVAVLPFADLSPNRDQEYLSEGIGVEILDGLSRIPGLRVFGRASSFEFKGGELPPTEIARRLGATAILVGSVRRDGSRIRVTARLVSGNDGTALWAETYARDLRDVFAIQDDIARDVAAALELKLLPTRIGPRTDVLEAYLAFLEAERITSQVSSPEDWARAEEAFELAIALDPEFAPPWARVSTIWGVWRAKMEDRPADREDARRHGLEAADRAIALAPDYGRGYAQRSFLRLCNQDVSGAHEDAMRALRLNPSDDLVVYRTANVFQAQGRLGEAVRAVRRAVDMNPLSSFRWQQLSLVCMGAGDLACARKAAVRALEVSPGQTSAEEYLALVDLLEGRAAEVARWAATRPEGYDRLIFTALAEHALGHTEESGKAVRALEASYGAADPFIVARVQAWRGKPDQAFALLERARAEGTALDALPFVASDPLLRALHPDPRWRPFLAKLNLEPIAPAP